MTTLRQIVNDAFRENNITDPEESISSAQFTEAVTRLKRIIERVYGKEIGEDFEQLSYGSNNASNSFARAFNREINVRNTYLPSNVRIMLNLTSSAEINLDPNPEDGARLALVDVSGNLSTNNLTINGNGRNIEGSTSVVLNTDSLNAEWFYRADLGNWVRVSSLTEASEMPFPTKFDDYFIIRLAMRLNPRYGAETRQETMMELQSVLKQLRAQYRQKHTVLPSIALQQIHPHRFNSYSFNNEDAFNVGRNI